MRSFKQIMSGARSRARQWVRKTSLDLRHHGSASTTWVDYGWMKLPYHADGDRQELYYHLDGAAWWKSEVRLISPFLKSGSTAVDVGANLGFVTSVLSGLVGPTGRVHSFEPSPSVFRKLCEVIEANALDNVTAHNLGCGELLGTLQLHLTTSSGNSSLRRRRELAHEVREMQQVQIIVLDEYLLPHLSRLDFLKIDTEGFEDAVLAGARGLLAKFRPVIYLELSSEYLEPSRRAVGILREAGYRFQSEPILEECHNGQNFFAFPSP